VIVHEGKKLPSNPFGYFFGYGPHRQTLSRNIGCMQFLIRLWHSSLFVVDSLLGSDYLPQKYDQSLMPKPQIMFSWRGQILEISSYLGRGDDNPTAFWLD
jgi:hypothetical protein